MSLEQNPGIIDFSEHGWHLLWTAGDTHFSPAKTSSIGSLYMAPEPGTACGLPAGESFFTPYTLMVGGGALCKECAAWLPLNAVLYEMSAALNVQTGTFDGYFKYLDICAKIWRDTAETLAVIDENLPVVETLDTTGEVVAALKAVRQAHESTLQQALDDVNSSEKRAEACREATAELIYSTFSSMRTEETGMAEWPDIHEKWMVLKTFSTKPEKNVRHARNFFVEAYVQFVSQKEPACFTETDAASLVQTYMSRFPEGRLNDILTEVSKDSVWYEELLQETFMFWNQTVVDMFETLGDDTVDFVFELDQPGLGIYGLAAALPFRPVYSRGAMSVSAPARVALVCGWNFNIRITRNPVLAVASGLLNAGSFSSPVKAVEAAKLLSAETN